MTPAGWYDDPANPGAERFWDGTQWTEHTRTPPPPSSPPPPPPPPQLQPPFSGAGGGYNAAPDWTVRHPGGKLNRIGDWLNRSFAATLEQALPLSIFFLVPFVVFAVAYLIGHLAVQDVVVTGNGNGIDGLNTGLLIVAGVVAFLATLVAIAVYLAAHHQLYGSVVGQPPAWSQSLSTGFRRLPTFVGVSLLFFLAVVAPIAVAAILILAVEAPALFLVLIPLMLVFVVWLTVKWSLITVAVAVAPVGSSGLSAGWNSTNGFFWAIFGRVILIGFVVNVLLLVQQMLGGVLWPLAVGSRLEFDQFGRLMVNGQLASTLDVVVVADVLPNPITFLVVLGVLFYVQFMIQAVSFAGSAALYADTGGANSFGHR